MLDAEQEIALCRGLADRAAFVIGFGRSNTTIVLRMINTASRALLLGEANFWVGYQIPNFRDWYNQMHEEGNGAQLSKSSYAPDFLASRDHSYSEWLSAALEHYDLVGEKVALASHCFVIKSPTEIRNFYESRFFSSKYIFLLRDPIQTILSAVRLFGAGDPAVLRREMVAWLTYVQLWADFIRVFPHTLSVASDIDQTVVSDILRFLGLESSHAWLLLDVEEKRLHSIPAHFDDLARHADALSDIFGHVQAAIAADPVYREAGQRRDLALNDTRASADSATRNKPRDLGQAWAKAEALKATLAAT